KAAAASPHDLLVEVAIVQKYGLAVMDGEVLEGDREQMRQVQRAQQRRRWRWRWCFQVHLTRVTDALQVREWIEARLAAGSNQLMHRVPHLSFDLSTQSLRRLRAGHASTAAVRSTVLHGAGARRGAVVPTSCIVC